MNESQKEFSKFGIDVGKELLKELAKTPEEKFIDCAKLCGIKKIKQSKYLFFNSFYCIFLSIEGGDINRFCNLIGLKILSQSQKYGIVDCINKNDCILLEEKILYIE